MSIESPEIVNSPKPPIVIVTKRVEEGDSIPALPDWSKFHFDHKDYPINKNRLANIMINDFVSTHKDHTKPSDRN